MKRVALTVLAAACAAACWAAYDLNKTLTRALRLPEEPQHR